MPKSLIGRIENEKFAFFWLLVGGSIGNILLVVHSLGLWPVFLPSAILSVLIAITMAGKKQRPKVWLWIDLLLTFITWIGIVGFLGEAQINLALLPDLLIIFGCVLGIMNW